MPRFPKPSSSLVVAVTALVFATTGSAVGASLITGQQIKNNSITGTDIRNKSLTALDFQGSVRGADGATGPQGPSGAPGAPGTIAATAEAYGPEAYLAPTGSGGGSVNSSKAECPAGTVVVGGGWDAGVRDFIGYAGKSGNGYFVIAINNGSIDSSVTAQAICGTKPAGTRATTRATTSAIAAAEVRKVADLREQLGAR